MLDGAFHCLFPAQAICEDRYNRDYARLVDQLRNDPHDYAVSCVRALRPKFPMGMDAEIRAQCLASTFTRDGVARLNARLLATLGSLEADVGVVDGFGLTDGRCDETKDGRHYPARARRNRRARRAAGAGRREAAGRGVSCGDVCVCARRRGAVGRMPTRPIFTSC